MGVLRRLPNLLTRTAQAFVPALARPADDEARVVLSDCEYELYSRMDVRDRAHAAHVARRVRELAPAAPRDLLAAAYLHDVGKSLGGFNPVHRVIAHLYTPAGQPESPVAEGLRGAWQLRQHHERLGADMIRAAGGSERVATLIEALGDDSPGDGPYPGDDAFPAELALLRAADGET